MSCKQQGRQAILCLALALVAVCGCSEDAETLCRRTPPPDVATYRSEIERARADKERAFRTDSDSPVPAAKRAAWKGLAFYPVDPSLRFTGPLLREVRADTFTIVASSGLRRPIRTVGSFALDLGAGVERLPVYQLLDMAPQDAGHLFVPFMDATTGKETYPAGRYLDVDEVARGRYVIDFNLAYNPWCAYGSTYDCPITPEQSRLRAAIRAGERGYEIEAAEVDSSAENAPAVR